MGGDPHSQLSSFFEGLIAADDIGHGVDALGCKNTHVLHTRYSIFSGVLLRGLQCGEDVIHARPRYNTFNQALGSVFENTRWITIGVSHDEPAGHVLRIPID